VHLEVEYVEGSLAASNQTREGFDFHPGRIDLPRRKKVSEKVTETP